MTDQPTISFEPILYQTEDSWTRVEGRLSISHAERTAWEVG